jgi:hypothetical protein
MQRRQQTNGEKQMSRSSLILASATLLSVTVWATALPAAEPSIYEVVQRTEELAQDALEASKHAGLIVKLTTPALKLYAWPNSPAGFGFITAQCGADREPIGVVCQANNFTNIFLVETSLGTPAGGTSDEAKKAMCVWGAPNGHLDFNNTFSMTVSCGKIEPKQ